MEKMNIKIVAKVQGKEEEVMLVSQAGKYVGKSRQAILKMINEGKIRAIRTPEVFLVFKKEIKKIKAKN